MFTANFFFAQGSTDPVNAVMSYADQQEHKVVMTGWPVRRILETQNGAREDRGAPVGGPSRGRAWILPERLHRCEDRQRCANLGRHGWLRPQLPLVVDSLVGQSVITRGRSGSHNINRVLQQALPYVMFANLYVLCLWVRSAANPSDDGTRHVPLRKARPRSQKVSWGDSLISNRTSRRGWT